jgi:hypothetical protein
MAVSSVFSIVIDSSSNPSTAYTARYNGVGVSMEQINDWGYVDFNCGGLLFSLALDTSTSPPSLYGWNN